MILPSLAPPSAAVPDGRRRANEGVGHFVSVSCGRRWWPLGRKSERFISSFSCFFLLPLIFRKDAAMGRKKKKQLKPWC